jgi:hypothetical protein
MSLKILQQGRDVFLVEAQRTSDVLPVGNYDLSFNEFKGYYLTKKDDFSLPSKIYGDPYTFATRVITTANTLREGGRGMAVLLSGKKGTGKSITAKVIAANSNRPVIGISVPYTGQGLTNFINGIETPCVFVLDEFEKTFSDADSRNYLLSLLDGMASSRHLFVLTSNESNIGEFFDSRPGRIRYHKQYNTLDNAIIHSIIDDKISDPTLNNAMKKAAEMFFDLSPDSLISMIEESLMYNEAPEQFLEFFNVRNQENTRFEAFVTVRKWQMKKARKGQLNFVERHSDLWYEIDNALDTIEEMNLTSASDVEGAIGADLIKHIEFSQQSYHSYYCNPFSDRQRIVVNWMLNTDRKSDSRDSYDLNWFRDECTIVRQGNDMFVTNNRTGDVLTLKVSETSKANAF